MNSYYYFQVALLLLLGVAIQIAGIVGSMARPTHIVSSEKHPTNHGCQLEIVNHLNDSRSFTSYDNLNEGQPCQGATSGVCHDGWCTNRESHFGLVTISEVAFHLAHSVNHTVAHICVTNSSHPVSFPLDAIKLGQLCFDYSFEHDYLTGSEHHFVFDSSKVHRLIPDTSLVHVQIFDQLYVRNHVAQSEHAQYYDTVKTANKPAPIDRPVSGISGYLKRHRRSFWKPAKSVFLGGASFSVQQLALEHRFKHDAPRRINLKLSNSGGQVQVQASWKGAL